MRLTRDTVFDIKTHNENFINYLEVIILQDGTVVYAVPSHQQKLLELYGNKYNITIEDIINKNIIPLCESPEDWIIYDLNVISVWYDFIIRPENITKEQQEILDKLKSEKCISESYKTGIVFKNKYGRLNRTQLK